MSESLNDAAKALEAAIAELNEYAKSRDPMLLRDAAEKGGWLAVSKAIEALLRAKGIEARTYRERRDALSRLGLDYLRDSTQLGRSFYTLIAFMMVCATKNS